MKHAMDLEVLCLQKHPQFIDQSIELLNNQWSRSRTARYIYCHSREYLEFKLESSTAYNLKLILPSFSILRSFEQGSADGLPTSLVLIDKQYGRGKERVLAHSKISPVPSNNKLCFVESVVVAPDLRGKGLGRLIMEKTEDFVLSKGITTVYLTTFDQQAFYQKLGYSLSEPVVVFGGRCQSLNKILERNTEKVQGRENSVKMNATPSSRSETKQQESAIISSPAPPPLPPPLPLMNHVSEIKPGWRQNIEISLPNTEVKVTMKKILVPCNS